MPFQRKRFFRHCKLLFKFFKKDFVKKVINLITSVILDFVLKVERISFCTDVNFSSVVNCLDCKCFSSIWMEKITNFYNKVTIILQANRWLFLWLKHNIIIIVFQIFRKIKMWRWTKHGKLKGKNIFFAINKNMYSWVLKL